MPTVCTGVYIFEIRELWLASTDPTQPATSSKVAKSKLSSPIASSHKRARSVDTGRDMQQPGPPSKLSRSHSADNLAVRKADPPRVPPLTYGANLADEVDYGDSPDPSPRMSWRATSSKLVELGKAEEEALWHAVADQALEGNCDVAIEASILVYQIKLQPKATSHTGRGQRDCQASFSGIGAKPMQNNRPHVVWLDFHGLVHLVSW